MKFYTIRILQRIFPDDVLQIIANYAKPLFLKISINRTFISNERLEVMFTYFDNLKCIRSFKTNEEYDYYPDYFYVYHYSSDVIDYIYYNKTSKSYTHRFVGMSKILTKEEDENVQEEFSKFSEWKRKKQKKKMIK